MHQDPRERRSDPQETKPDLPVFEALLGSNGLIMACCGDRSIGNSCPRMHMKAKVFLDVTFSLTIEPTDSRTVPPQAK